MVNKKESLIILGIFILSLNMGVNAGVYLSQPNSIYNLGDFVDLNFTIDPIVDGPFKLKLVCDGNSVDIFNGPAIENLVLPLNDLWVHNLSGSCYFLSNYGGEEKKTNPNFIITNKLNMILETESFFAKPDETIIISGNVTRANGINEDGEVEILIPFKGVIAPLDNSTISSTNTTVTNTTENSTVNVSITNSSDFNKFYGKINNGEFSVSLRLPDDVASGDYVLLINSYDLSSNKRINQGAINAKLRIPQILRRIEVALNNQIFDPGQNISIKSSLYDQAGLSIMDSSLIIIKNSAGDKIYDRVVASSDETGIFEIPFDFSSGYYSIEVSSGDKKISKNVFVNEKAKIFFEVRNDTLYLKNIGNTRYNKEVQVDIDGKPFIKSVNLAVGEEKEFYLSGQNQSYNIKATDGESSMDQNNVLLTGHAVDVADSRKVELGNLFSNPLIWFFLILIIAVAITLLMKKVVKRRSVAKPSNYYGKPKHLKLEGVIRKEKEDKKPEPTVIRKKLSFIPVVPPTEAMQGLITQGHRNPAVMVVLKIKNKITPFAKEFVQKSINSVYSRKGAIYEQGEYVIAIFSPIATKSFKNEVDGSKVAEDICNFLLDYNKKFKEPIQFGIGVNSGEIINEIKDGKLLFTALGNTLVLAKRLSELSKEEVLLSESVYHKGMSEIQAEKKSFGEVVAFKIKKIVDYEKNKKFIDDFLKRAEKDSSGVKYVRSDGYLSKNRVGNGLPTANTLIRDAQKNNNVTAPRKDNSTGTNYVDFR